MSKFFKKIFASKNWSPKLPKRGIKHFSISNINRLEKKIWSLPFQPLLDFPGRTFWLFLSLPSSYACRMCTIEPHMLGRFAHSAQGHMHLTSVFGYFIRDSMYVFCDCRLAKQRYRTARIHPSNPSSWSKNPSYEVLNRMIQTWSN